MPFRSLSWPLTLLLAALPALATEQAPATPPPPAAVPAPVEGAPAVEFEAVNLDLGRIPEGQDATGAFLVRNTGRAELKLLQVKPG